jgi:hypothetical protein
MIIDRSESGLTGPTLNLLNMSADESCISVALAKMYLSMHEKKPG